MSTREDPDPDGVLGDLCQPLLRPPPRPIRTIRGIGGNYSFITRIADSDGGNPDPNLDKEPGSRSTNITRKTTYILVVF